MIQVIYRTAHRPTNKVIENRAWFPNYKAVVNIIVMWNKSEDYDYHVVETEEVHNNPDMWHPDCHHYRHLWE